MYIFEREVDMLSAVGTRDTSRFLLLHNMIILLVQALNVMHLSAHYHIELTLPTVDRAQSSSHATRAKFRNPDSVLNGWTIGYIDQRADFIVPCKFSELRSRFRSKRKHLLVYLEPLFSISYLKQKYSSFFE